MTSVFLALLAISCSVMAHADTIILGNQSMTLSRFGRAALTTGAVPDPAPAAVDPIGSILPSVPLVGFGAGGGLGLPPTAGEARLAEKTPQIGLPLGLPISGLVRFGVGNGQGIASEIVTPVGALLPLGPLVGFGAGGGPGLPLSLGEVNPTEQTPDIGFPLGLSSDPLVRFGAGDGQGIAAPSSILTTPEISTAGLTPFGVGNGSALGLPLNVLQSPVAGVADGSFKRPLYAQWTALTFCIVFIAVCRSAFGCCPHRSASKLSAGVAVVPRSALPMMPGTSKNLAQPLSEFIAEP